MHWFKIPTIWTEFAKINGLFKLVLSATTTTALRCILLLLPRALKRPFTWRKRYGCRPGTVAVRASVCCIRTGRHCDVLDEESVPLSGAFGNIAIRE